MNGLMSDFYSIELADDAVVFVARQVVHVTEAEQVKIADFGRRRFVLVGPGADGSLQTLIAADELRWPDALSFGPGGYLYIADSALSELILQSREHIESQGPYRIYRFRPGFEGVPGQ